MRVWHRLAIGVVALSFLCGPATAQPPGGGARAIEQADSFVLLLNDLVQDDLQLDQAQRDRLRKLPDAVRAKYRQQRDALERQIREMQAKTVKAQQAYYQGVDAAVARILKPEQVKRLKQIESQALGLALFDDPEAAAALRLTGPQKEGAHKIFADLGKARMALFAKGGGVTAQEFAKLSQTAHKAIVETLTDEQKAALKGLLGEPSPLAGRVPPFGTGERSNDPPRRILRLNLLPTPELAEELKLGDEQTEAIKAAGKELRAKALQALQALAPPGGVSPQFLLNQLLQKMAGEARTEAEDEVLRPAQKRRLEQLLLQARGLPMFEDVAVLKALKLTPEQAKAVVGAGRDIAKKRQEFAREMSKTKIALPEAMERLARREAQLHREAVAGLVAGFGDAQKQAWENLTGKAVDLAKAGITPATADVSPSRGYSNAANAAYNRGEFGRALAGFDESLHLDEDNALACNSKAWLLATCPEEKHRDGLEAIRLAKKACALTKDKVASFLDTLAAAYAEAGEFEEAVTAQTRALEIAAPQERDEFAARLKLFREKKKYRETPGKGAP